MLLMTMHVDPPLESARDCANRWIIEDIILHDSNLSSRFRLRESLVPSIQVIGCTCSCPSKGRVCPIIVVVMLACWVGTGSLHEVAFYPCRTEFLLGY